MADTVLLVNANRIRPPVAPVALDYLGTALEDAGFEVRILDLAWSLDPAGDIAKALAVQPVFVGLTFRNLDDSSAASRRSFVDEHRDVVREIRLRTDAPVILGGAGLSIAPGAAVRALGAHAAVRGEGEAAVVAMARKRPSGGPPVDLASIPTPRRTFVDNARYLKEGAQVGFETSRGCDGRCAYCADPLSKGCRVRTRSPQSVADELESLARSGVDVFHTCDGEFNADPVHAEAVCAELAARGLGGKIRWYAYGRPDRFPPALAAAMRAAGCAGINFGVDHTDARMLGALGRAHRLEDIVAARAACRRAGIAVMLDLLFGGPGEKRRTIQGAVEAVRAMDPEAAGIALGVRLYRGTPLGDRLAPPGIPPRPGVTGATDDLLEPAFFVEPGLGEDVGAHIGSLVAGDRRFFYLGPAASGEVSSYNYNGNDPLERAIAGGARGAYWDILRSMR
jgi:hypothetical protein